MQRFSNNFVKGCVALAALVAYMSWVSPSGNDVLGNVVMVSAIIALAMYHRIAGIIAVLIVIAWIPMKEGFSINDHPLMPTMPSSSAIQFNTDDEFREKYCMKGIAQSAANMPADYEYMLSPALFNDTNGKPQFKPEVIKQMNIPSFNAANSCKEDPPNNFLTVANMCDSGCNWTTNPTTAPTTAPTMAPNTTESFTPMLRPHIRRGRKFVTDSAANVNSGLNRLKRQLF